MPSEFAHAMRSAELAIATPLLPTGGRILELGAGDGWQAALLSRKGFVVTAVDVARVARGAEEFAPVSIYDGRTLPFPDGSFDAIYSSNVLEHVKDFGRIQAELARVLTTNGVAVHCVPSATWRFWTTLGHPFYATRWLFNSRRHTATGAQSQTPHIESMSLLELLRLGLIAPRHGEHGNLVSEHYLFSRAGWRRRFERSGWQISTMRPTGLFYSGNELAALHMASGFRESLARVLGSSTLMLVARPQLPRSRPSRAT